MVPQNPFEGKGFSEILEQISIPAIILLIGIGAFGLGRLSALQEARGTLIIHPPDDLNAIAAPLQAVLASSGQMAAAAVATQTSGAYVASKNGTKYYLPTCSGAKTIKDENKIWFQTVTEAQAQGYTPAANCKGL